MHKLAVISVSALAVVAASAGSASASTFCVQDAACVASGAKDESTNIQAALNDAAANPGPDRVQTPT
jgi:hypothetical protein